MLISTMNPETLSREQVTRLVFDGVSGPAAPGDCVFVFGGRSEARASKAAELYHAGMAPLVHFTGGTKWGEWETPHAILLQQFAMAAGVPEENTSVARDSNHTKEDVLDSLLVLDRKVGLHNLRHIIMVSVPWHARRCLLTLRTYAPQWINYSWAPADLPLHHRHNWWQTSKVETRVRKEARGLVAYVREGQLIDEDVDA